jgi:hypothetical protein
MQAYLRGIETGRFGAHRAALAVFAALFFAFVQIAFAAHAASEHATAPAHKSVNCVLCVGAGGGHAGAAQNDFILPLPVFAAALVLVLLAAPFAAPAAAPFSARAPPKR